MGGALFLLSLLLPCVDNHYGDFAAGMRVKGYQCLFGLPLMPFIVPLATPLWLALLAGNLWAIAAPWVTFFQRSPQLWQRRARWPALLSIAAALVLTILRSELGLKAVHGGYVVWVPSLLLVGAGAWLPWPKTGDP